MIELTNIINQVLANKGKPITAMVTEASSLRSDFGFDSLDLAEFTVRVEEKFGIDIFEDGLVDTIGEVMKKIGK
jgi:acyl carrier protein